MNLQKNMIMSLFGAMLFMLPKVTHAEQSEVIFKIHDITPVEENGEVKSCSFGVTLYNRTPEMISNLGLNLSWTDDVIAEQIEAEKNEKVYDDKGNVKGYKGQSETEKNTTKKVFVSLSVPPLPQGKQISIKSSINTDRCFLLLQKPTIVVESCNYGSGKNTDKKAGVCKNLFTYVSPNDGEYYSDFKQISYTEEVEDIKNQAEREKKEMEKIYSEALSSVNRISQTLNTMK